MATSLRKEVVVIRPRQRRLTVSIIKYNENYYFMHDCMFIEAKVLKTQDPTGKGKMYMIK